MTDGPGSDTSAVATERPRRWSRPDPAALALIGVATAWVVVFSVLVVRRHNGFSDFGFDMGIYEQAVWLLAHGRGFMTVRGLPVFGHHGTFVLALFAPASWFGAGPNFLNVVQVVVLALGVVPLYLLARERHLPSWVAAVVGAALLLHPAVQFFSWELFHPETIAITPLLCAYLCSVRKSWGWFAFWAVLAVSCKEDLAIAVIVLGLLIAFRGDRRRGLMVAAVAAIWFVFISQALIPLVSGHPAAYEGLYSGVGGSPDGIVRTAFEDPGNITGRIFSSESSDFAWRLFAPFGLAPVVAPAGMLLGAPQFLLDVISDVSWTREITYRYAALPVAGLAIAMVEGVAFARRRVGMIALCFATTCVAVGALYGTLAWGPSPIGAEYDKGWWPLATDARLVAKQAAVAKIPSDASVSATYTFVPHLSDRAEIYQYPNPFRKSYWGVPGTPTRSPSRIDWVVVDQATMGPDDMATFESLITSGDFKIVYERDGVLLARRDHH